MSTASFATQVIPPGLTSYRWKIRALLFFATLIACVDRGVIGYLEEYLEVVIGFQLAIGRIVHATNSYIPLFAVACSAYLVALLFIQLLAPKLTPAALC